MNPSRARLVSFAMTTTLALLASGCGGGSGGGEPRTLTSIALGPAVITVARGATLQLSAIGSYSDGSGADLSASATWTSSDATVATVSSTGLLTGIGNGATRIQAASGGVAGTRDASVTGPAATTVAVTPATADIIAGGTLPLKAQATYADGTTEDVTARVTWTWSGQGISVASGGVASAALDAIVGRPGSATACLALVTCGTAQLLVVRGPPIVIAAGNDPLSVEEWYLYNTGQAAFSDKTGTKGADLRLTRAFRLGLTGKNVKVAVVDTGLEIAHEDLGGNVVKDASWNFVTGTTDPTPPITDTKGDHGTSVSGIIAMVYDNKKGGMGVAPRVGLSGYNWLSMASDPRKPWEQAQLTSLGGSAASPPSAGVWIFNQSFGSSELYATIASDPVEAQYRLGVSSLRSGLGAIYVKSAGNGFLDFENNDKVKADCTLANLARLTCQNANMDGDNALPYNLVVGALNANGERSSYSTAGSSLWVSAPGGEYGFNESVWGADLKRPFLFEPAMVSADRSTCAYGYARTAADTSTFNQGRSPLNVPCDYTNTMNGTSSAAPSTTGAIALLLDATPSLTWREVRRALAMKSFQVNPGILPVEVQLSDGPYVAELGWTKNAAGYNFHNWYGFGAVDVDAVVELVSTTRWSLGTFTDTDWIAGKDAPGALIPDDKGVGRTSVINVPVNLRVEAVQIEVQIVHARPGDLGIELTSPSGTKSILLNIRNGFAPPVAPSTGPWFVLLSNAFYEESAKGDWTVKIVDGRTGEIGTLTQWKIRVFGH
jgi:subtilisin family serine protease